MKLAIIDSGIDGNQFKCIDLRQYRVDKDKIELEEAIDNMGHGTNMLGIILSESLIKPEVISYRPVIHKNQLSNLSLAFAIQDAVKLGCNLINISMGNNNLFERLYVDKACEVAYNAGVKIICAFSNNNDIVVPWASPYTLKVIQGDTNDQSIHIKKYIYGNQVLSVEKKVIRYRFPDGRKKFTVGHSAAAAFITGRMLKLFCVGEENMMERLLSSKEKIELSGIYQKIETFKKPLLDSEISKVHYKSAAVIPFSKEMESMINFQEYTNIDKFVVGVEFGSCRDMVSLNISGKKLKLISQTEQLMEYELDLIVIGYLDKLTAYKEDANYGKIVDIAIKKKADIYSFLPLEKKFKEKCQKNNIMVYETKVYDKKFVQEMMDKVPFSILPKTPVLGIFGTSSKQGKFTLQMLIRQTMDRVGIRYAFVGTEHQSEFMDADICFPYGYAADKNIVIGMENVINVLSRMIYYVEQCKSPETFLIGGQSWLIPYDIENQTAIYNLVYLEATRPDYAVVVVNPEVDHEQYIQDTINCLIAVYKVRVLALAFSDKKNISKKNATYQIKRTKENMIETAMALSHRYGFLSGCVNDSEFVQRLVNNYLEIIED